MSLVYVYAVSFDPQRKTGDGECSSHFRKKEKTEAMITQLINWETIIQTGLSCLTQSCLFFVLK